MTDSSIASMGAAKMSCKAKANEIVEAVEARFAPVTDIVNVWGYDPNPSNEEHHSGLAADFMLYNKGVPGGIDTRAGNWIAFSRNSIRPRQTASSTREGTGHGSLRITL